MRHEVFAESVESIRLEGAQDHPSSGYLSPGHDRALHLCTVCTSIMVTCVHAGHRPVGDHVVDDVEGVQADNCATPFLPRISRRCIVSVTRVKVHECRETNHEEGNVLIGHPDLLYHSCV